MTNVLGRNPKTLGYSAVNPVVAAGHSQIAKARVKLLRQAEPPIYSPQSTPCGVNESTKKIVPISERTSLPEWARKINELRKRMKLGQEEFAEAVGVSQQTVSRWARGEREPNADAYRSIIHLSGDREEDISKFLLGRFGELTGLNDFAKQFAFEQYPKLNQRIMAAEKELEKLRSDKDAVVVPLLRDAAAAGTPRAIDEKEIESELVLPRQWIGRRSSITAIRVEGDSMSPILEAGYVVLVDTSERDPKKLVNQMVAARDDDGVTIKWLRKQDPKSKSGDEMYILLPNHTSLRHPVRVITPGSESVSIVGKVVKWIGEPPAPRK